MDQDVKDIIIKYGSSIISSDTFRATFDQTHHYKTTLGDHTLGVTVEAVKFCLRYGLTDDRTLGNVVTSCLCHDLSLVGRDDKYRSNFETLRKHPGHSAEAYMDLTGENDERVLNAIRSHMFPLKPSLPRHKEGWILTLADKISASTDLLMIPPVTIEEREELLALSEEAAKDRPEFQDEE
ncbi:MAG: HD domain-containing protein [Eubacterium sp.]|nr:HD domain-containing protein [Eubacterium sp.]